MNLCQRLEHSRHCPQPLLFTLEGDQPVSAWTADHLCQDVQRLSAGLWAQGIRAGETVLILSGNRGESYLLMLALFNIGAIAAPLNSLLGNVTVQSILETLKPSACFYEAYLAPELYRQLAPHCRLLIRLANEADIQRSSLPTVSYSELLDYEGSGQWQNRDSRDPALIIHSSGSQGQPKRIAYNHGQLDTYLHFHDQVHQQFAEASAGSSEDSDILSPLLSVFHPSHLAALSITLQGVLMQRPTHLLSAFSPRLYLHLLSRLRCRLSILVPSMYHALLQELQCLPGLDFSALTLCAVVGEPCPLPLRQRIEQSFQALVFSGYGLSECLPGIAHQADSLASGQWPADSVGTLCFGEARLVDHEGRDSNPGELWLRNPTVFPCYQDAAMNEERFTADGWIRTGDLFQRDRLGHYLHQGRIDDMFTANGKNIYPADIEAIFIQHPGVAGAIAAPLEQADGRLVPAVLLHTAQPLCGEALTEYFVERGPLHAVPRLIRCIDALPLLGPGKVDRRECRRLLQAAYYE